MKGRSEDDVVRRWWTLSPGECLPLSNGDTFQLLCAGRPGSASGPDVRDAVLLFLSSEKTCCELINTHQSQGKREVGDVEFHVRASDWFTHQHHKDARYNHVILHVVSICDDSTPTLRQDGTTIPLCSLNDLHRLNQLKWPNAPPHRLTGTLKTLWPCQTVMALISNEECTRLLRHAGLLRFEQKTHVFVEQLRTAQPHASFTAYDTCLITALAEGLGYGRDRAFFRAAGLQLLGMPDKVPEPLGHASDPAPLDAGRLRILGTLVRQWRTCGVWESIRDVIKGNKGTIACSCDLHSNKYDQLRSVFGGLSTSRTDILICNVVLPFAAAVALIENDVELAEQTRNHYLGHPGLSSNSITRAMCRQLQLAHEPPNACQQQGLHYIYAQTCREKHCQLCMAGRHPL